MVLLLFCYWCRKGAKSTCDAWKFFRQQIPLVVHTRTNADVGDLSGVGAVYAGSRDFHGSCVKGPEPWFCLKPKQQWDSKQGGSEPTPPEVEIGEPEVKPGSEL